ncbi:MAG: CAAX protease [Clostridium sp. SCN 57-10]|nr:MAG: CAAX protease [Clostridium sp. SCN 57-10]
MKAAKLKAIGLLTALLIVLSYTLDAIKKAIFLLVPRTDFSDHMASMVAMIVLTAIIIIACKKLHVDLFIFPSKFTVLYVCISIVVLCLLIGTPSNYTGSFRPIFLLFYSSIVTPVFEELIFRGFVWTKLNQIFLREWKTYIVSTILFALWHFGYISSIAFRIQDNLLDAMLWKVITGLCFGVVLGAVRLKTKNCYSTMLLHGILNIFGR